LKRARDYAAVSEQALDMRAVKRSLAMLEIDEAGLNQTDRDILTLLIEKYAGNPVGLKTIAAALSEEEATIEEVNEPYLMQTGLIDRTPRGRVATKKAYLHMGFKPPADEPSLGL
jgi:Holliday junction DNA helicase RuvB